MDTRRRNSPRTVPVSPELAQPRQPALKSRHIQNAAVTTNASLASLAAQIPKLLVMTVVAVSSGWCGPSLAWGQPAAAGGPVAGAPTDAAASQGFVDILFSGGVIGVTIILVIVGLSIATAYLVFEMLMTLRRNEIMPEGLADETRQLLSQGKFAEAEQLCRSRPSPLAFVILTGLTELDFGWTAMEKAMEDGVSEQAARLYRRIEYLSVIGNIAPMCGLLGTVTGMIFAFQQVAISQGTAGAGDLAQGIYSALVTTVAGLVVAIPALGAFAVFRNRIDQLVAETAYLAAHVFGPVRRRAVQKSAGTVVPAATRPPAPPQPPRT
jgi:biopolymer transport protein ExbB